MCPSLSQLPGQWGACLIANGGGQRGEQVAEKSARLPDREHRDVQTVSRLHTALGFRDIYQPPGFPALFPWIPGLPSIGGRGRTDILFVFTGPHGHEGEDETGNGEATLKSASSQGNQHQARQGV